MPVDLTGHGTSLDTFGAAEASMTSDDPARMPRGWWKTDPTRTRTDGLEESLAFLRDILRTQRFEGVFGFSQGAGLAALLAALVRKILLYTTRCPQRLTE
jgi:pimeloyl-ACP methyl ester carboxylesterase